MGCARELGNTHMRSTSSLRHFPSAEFEPVPVLVDDDRTILFNVVCRAYHSSFHISLIQENDDAIGYGPYSSSS